MKTRAIGYDLSQAETVDVAGAGLTHDLKLVETKELSKQMMNAEWLASWPGTDADKQFAINCNHCHSFEITANTGTAEQWVKVLDRMDYANGATMEHPFRNPYHPEYAKHWGEYASQITQTSLPRGSDEEGTVAVSPQRAKQSAYLVLDRTNGAIKEWAIDVPCADPYDVDLDRHGNVWTAGMLTDYVFKLNPTTGAITKYLAPTVNMNVRRINVDQAENPAVWIGENHHGRILKVEALE